MAVVDDVRRMARERPPSAWARDIAWLAVVIGAVLTSLGLGGRQESDLRAEVAALQAQVSDAVQRLARIESLLLERSR